MEFLILHKAEFLGFLFAFSELLSLIPSVKSNGVFQLVLEALKKVKGE